MASGNFFLLKEEAQISTQFTFGVSAGEIGIGYSHIWYNIWSSYQTIPALLSGRIPSSPAHSMRLSGKIQSGLTWEAKEPNNTNLKLLLKSFSLHQHFYFENYWSYCMAYGQRSYGHMSHKCCRRLLSSFSSIELLPLKMSKWWRCRMNSDESKRQK